jgi:hypothetical protein
VRKIRQIQYFYTTVRDRPGEAYGLLSHLEEAGVNLLAFNAVPAGLDQTQLVLFPDDGDKLKHAGAAGGFELRGPHFALLIQGDDGVGAVAEIHRILSAAGINVSAANGVTDGKGGYGYVIYVREGELARASQSLGI